MSLPQVRWHSQTSLEVSTSIPFAVHDGSKTLASPGDADLRRLRRLGMIRRSHDPGHPDAHTDADWRGDSTNRKSLSGGILKIVSATLREFTGQSCQTL